MTQSTKLVITIFGCAGFLIGYFLAPLIYAELNKQETELLSPLSEPESAVFVPRAEAYQEPIKVAEITGKASYYNRGICELHGTVYGETCLTKNGEVFDDRALIAACPRTLLGEYITVTHNDKSITVKCTDTGSFGEKYNRVLDLSQGAFEQLAPSSRGVIQVSYSVEG